VIIGLTGTLAAGKGEFCKYLESKGFQVYSLSDIIREELRSKGIEISRESLQATGNELRTRFGSAVLAKRTCKKLKSGKNYVIDSIRNPAEIDELRKVLGFKLCFIDAPIKKRYERIISRRREGEENLTFKKFSEQENKELRSKDPASQQLIACRDMADYTVINDLTIDKFHKRIDELLAEQK
jgi:dephospho-CoA kinase